MVDTPESFAKELRDAPDKVSRQARGIMAKKLDAAAASAQSEVQGIFSGQGRSDTRSASTIRARMSATIGAGGGGRQVGYLLADGRGVFHLERGGRHTPPNPVLARHGQQALEAAGPEIAQAAADL